MSDFFSKPFHHAGSDLRAGTSKKKLNNTKKYMMVICSFELRSRDFRATPMGSNLMYTRCHENYQMYCMAATIRES